MTDRGAPATGRPLVLCYHAVSDTFKSGLAVSKEQLREQMSILVDRGYRAMTFKALEQMRQSGADVSTCVAVTFDDGYESTLLAAEVLSEFGIAGTVFVVPPAVSSEEPMSWPGIARMARGQSAHELRAMNLDQLTQLAESGWEVGSHTLSHRRLPRLDDVELRRELTESRDQIVQQIGACSSVAYPYGKANARVAEAAAQAGYEAGTTLAPWHRHDSPMLRPRIGVFRHDSRRRFELKIANWTLALRRIPALAT